MPTETRKQLEHAIQEQTEYFAKVVKPELDALESTILPHQRMDRISSRVREKYEALCQQVDQLKRQGADKLDAVLSTDEQRLLEMVPLLDEACRLERELSLLLPGVAEFRPDDTVQAVTDSRIYKRAVRLHEITDELLRLVEMATGPKDETHDKLYRAISEAGDIANDLIERNPIRDTVFWQLEADAAVLEEYLERNRRKLRDLGRRAHIALYDTSAT